LHEHAHRAEALRDSVGDMAPSLPKIRLKTVVRSILPGGKHREESGKYDVAKFELTAEDICMMSRQLFGDEREDRQEEHRVKLSENIGEEVFGLMNGSTLRDSSISSIKNAVGSGGCVGGQAPGQASLMRLSSTTSVELAKKSSVEAPCDRLTTAVSYVPQDFVREEAETGQIFSKRESAPIDENAPNAGSHKPRPAVDQLAPIGATSAGAKTTLESCGDGELQGTSERAGERQVGQEGGNWCTEAREKPADADVSEKEPETPDQGSVAELCLSPTSSERGGESTVGDVRSGYSVSTCSLTSPRSADVQNAPSPDSHISPKACLSNVSVEKAPAMPPKRPRVMTPPKPPSYLPGFLDYSSIFSGVSSRNRDGPEAPVQEYEAQLDRVANGTNRTRSRILQLQYFSLSCRVRRREGELLLWSTDVRTTSICRGKTSSELVVHLARCKRPFVFSFPDAAELLAAISEESNLVFEDRFTTKRNLGRGAFARVDEVAERNSGRRFAAKIFEQAKNQDQADSNRGEVELLRSLTHPNLVRTYCSVSTRSGQEALVLENVHGGDLFDFVIDRRRLDEKEALAVLRQLASVLKMLHANNIVHNDLKLENVLCASFDPTLQVKLCDLGLASRLEAKDPQKPPLLIGTLGYLSPEMLLRKDCGTAVDIWALGVMLHVLISGKMPFFGKTDLDVKKKIVIGRVPLSGPVWRTVSPQVTSLLLKMLRVKQLERISASDIIIEIDKILGS